MNHEFWIDRWRENRIGFHNERTHPLLRKWWPRVTGGTPGRVLVPLCGKSRDLVWLARQGHDVVGIEVSEIAARAFASEQGIEFDVVDDDPFIRMKGGQIEIDVGDFFAATPEKMGRFDLGYDRAALIALPRETRPSYALKLNQLLEENGFILLITIEWDMSESYGPPFGVGEAEVRALFEGIQIQRLEARDCLEEEPRFRERGATWMKEVAYALGAPARPAV